VPEIAHRAGIDAIGADSGLRDVEIHLHDPALAPDIFDQDGEIGLERLSHIAAPLPQEDVLRGLLTDRRSAADAVAPGLVAVIGLFDRLEVEAVVQAEARILGRNRREDFRGALRVKKEMTAYVGMPNQEALIIRKALSQK